MKYIFFTIVLFSSLITFGQVNKTSQLEVKTINVQPTTNSTYRSTLDSTKSVDEAKNLEVVYMKIEKSAIAPEILETEEAITPLVREDKIKTNLITIHRNESPQLRENQKKKDN